MRATLVARPVERLPVRWEVEVELIGSYGADIDEGNHRARIVADVLARELSRSNLKVHYQLKLQGTEIGSATYVDVVTAARILDRAGVRHP